MFYDPSKGGGTRGGLGFISLGGEAKPPPPPPPPPTPPSAFDQGNGPPSPPTARIISNLALTPGTRLGVYEVTAPIGEGGMGEVYRARDTKLNRDVALKVLPDAFARSRPARAVHSAKRKTLASLNHPNIAAHLRARRKRGHDTPS